jgi:hypothetical protein
MPRRHVLWAATIAALLVCSTSAFAGPGDGKGGRQTQSVQPGAMPKERARIMGYGPDDPRAAADARRNLGNDQATLDHEAKLRKEDRKKAKQALRGR